MALDTLLAHQDWVISRVQALAGGLSRRAIEYRLSKGRWRVLLPGLYLAAPVRPTWTQLQIAALLYAGPLSALDDVDACQHYRLSAVARPGRFVFVVVPESARARSVGYLRVRRTRHQFQMLYAGPRRFVDPATALVAVSRRMTDERQVLAAFSEAVQRRVVSPKLLVATHERVGGRHTTLANAALLDIQAGVRSAPEGDFRHLAIASLILPPLLYNRRLRLPTGRIVIPDALALDAALVHETNGRGPHEREDLFDGMQDRHDAMTEGGLTALHSSPRRLRVAGGAAIAQFERVYLRLRGRGLPPGVTLLDD
jgi:hypothetical protein